MYLAWHLAGHLASCILCTATWLRPTDIASVAEPVVDFLGVELQLESHLKLFEIQKAAGSVGILQALLLLELQAFQPRRIEAETLPGANHLN